MDTLNYWSIQNKQQLRANNVRWLSKLSFGSSISVSINIELICKWKLPAALNWASWPLGVFKNICSRCWGEFWIKQFEISTNNDSKAIQFVDWVLNWRMEWVSQRTLPAALVEHRGHIAACPHRRLILDVVVRVQFKQIEFLHNRHNATQST